jgi:hypothetical protein
VFDSLVRYVNRCLNVIDICADNLPGNCAILVALNVEGAEESLQYLSCAAEGYPGAFKVSPEGSASVAEWLSKFGLEESWAAVVQSPDRVQ